MKMQLTYIPFCSAILMYLARQHNLGGNTDLEAAEINAIGFLYQDYVKDGTEYMMIAAGRREGDKASF